MFEFPELRLLMATSAAVVVAGCGAAAPAPDDHAEQGCSPQDGRSQATAIEVGGGATCEEARILIGLGPETGTDPGHLQPLYLDGERVLEGSAWSCDVGAEARDAPLDVRCSAKRVAYAFALTSTRDPRTSLRRCDPNSPFDFDGGGWGARVSGVSCHAVGRFIQWRFFDDYPIRAGKAGIDQVAGKDCAWRAFRSEPGFHHVTCSRSGELFTFDMTP